MENTAKDYDQFQSQAKGFVAKAKEHNAKVPADQRITSTAIANTIKMMFEVFKQDQANKITPYQQAQLDMQKESMAMAQKEFEQGKMQMVTDADGNQKLVRIKPDGSVVEVYSSGTTGGPSLSDLEDDTQVAAPVSAPVINTPKPISGTPLTPEGSGYNAGRSTNQGPEIWSTDFTTSKSPAPSSSANMSMAPRSAPQVSQAPATQGWFSNFQKMMFPMG